jgi:hypothetical protein
MKRIQSQGMRENKKAKRYDRQEEKYTRNEFRCTGRHFVLEAFDFGILDPFPDSAVLCSSG